MRTGFSRLTTMDALTTAALAFVCSRLFCGLFVYLGNYYRQANQLMPGVWEGASNKWLNPWTTYDSAYYLSIARTGYETLTAPFFPLYPLLLRLGGDTQTGMVIAGVLISNLTFAAALYVLYLLTEMDYGQSAAKAAVWLLAFFPTTAFFSALYTESTFLLLLLLCFYAAHQHQWMAAGICGALASLSRNPGALLCLVLVLEYLRAQNFSWRKLEVPHLFFASLPLVSFVGVQVYLWGTLGTPFASVAVQQQFYRAPSWPWEPVWRDLLGFFSYLNYDLVTFVNLACICAVVYLTIRYRQRIRPTHALLLYGLVLMNLTYSLRVPPETTGAARYLSTAFPFIQLLGYHVTRPATLWNRRRLACSGIYAYLCFLFSFLFGLKSFLG